MSKSNLSHKRKRTINYVTNSCDIDNRFVAMIDVNVISVRAKGNFCKFRDL